MRTGPEYAADDQPRYGAGRAVLWRLSYARCLDKESIVVCIESPVDVAPATTLSSLNALTPHSYSSLLVTPGVRLQSKALPAGFLPFNYYSLGAGPARYVATRRLLDGSTAAAHQRTTTWVFRAEGGLSISVTDRVGLRTGVMVEGGGLPAWLEDSSAAWPEGERLPEQRVGGHVMLSVRF